MALVQQLLSWRGQFACSQGYGEVGRGTARTEGDFLHPPCERLRVVASLRDWAGHLLEPAWDYTIVTLCREGEGIRGGRERKESAKVD